MGRMESLAPFMRNILLFLLAAFSLHAQIADLVPEDTLQAKRMVMQPSLPIDSIATSDDISALYFNPAGLAYHPFQVGYFLGHNPDDSLQDHSIFFNLLGLAFSTQWRLAPEDRYARRITLGQGVNLGPAFSMGTSYSWFHSSESWLNNYDQWDLGFMLRPWRVLSLGAVARRLNRPEFNGELIMPYWDLGIAIRPIPKWSEVFTFSVDTTVSPENSWEDLVPRYFIEIQPTRGISLYGGWDNYQNVFMGIHLPIESSRFSFQLTTPQHAGSFYSTGAVIGTERFPSSLTSTGLKRTLIISLAGEFPEYGAQSLFLKRKKTFYELLALLDAAKRDKNIGKIIVEPSGFQGGWAQAEELQKLLANIDTTKPVYAYMESSSPKELFIASAAREISMPRSSSLHISGLSAQVYYVGAILEKFGIDADFIKIGDYKSAPEMFENAAMSSQEKEQLTALITDMENTIYSAIAKGRRIDESKWSNIRKAGILTATQARNAGLIDHVEYEDELKERLRPELIRDSFYFVDMEQYSRTAIYDDQWGIKPAIALLILEGPIARGDSLLEESISLPSVQKSFRSIAANPQIKALVIRINSPGGSAEETDFIFREIELLKKARKNFPVIISIGNIAASGGYYLAASGDSILVNETSLTGSIGIYTGKFSLKELYARLGVNKEVVKINESADLYTESRTFSEEERAMISANLSSFYDLFLERVSAGRRLEGDALTSVAGGRIFSGTASLSRKLADKSGGLLPALELARTKADINSNYMEIALIKKSGISTIPLLNSLSERLPVFSKEIARDIARTEALGNDYVYFLLPYEIEIQ